MKNSKFGTILISLVLALCFLPCFIPVIDDNVDGALAYFINFAFAENRELFNHMIFPHGPLGWLLYPLSFKGHLTAALIFKFVLNLSFMFFGITLFKQKSGWLNIFALLSLTILLSIFDSQFLIIGTQFFLILHFLKSNEKSYLITGIVFLVLSGFIKAYPFILALSFWLPLFIYLFFTALNKRSFIIQLVFGAIIGFLLMRLLIFKNLAGSINHIVGFVGLSGNNSDGAALYVQNNWLLLVGFVISILLIFIIRPVKEKWIFLLIFGFSVFLQWKYSMARQDVLHSRMLIMYIPLLYFGFLSYTAKRSWIDHFLITLSCGFYFINHFAINDQSGVRPRTTNFNCLFDEIYNVGNSERNSGLNNSIAANYTLSENSLHRIGNEKVEIYPNQFLFMYNHKLNWTSRPVLQSYAAYTSKLDKYNFDYFDSTKAPRFIVWHLSQPDLSPWHKQSFASLDTRSVLNDEPQTIQLILSKYQIIESSSQYLLLEKIHGRNIGPIENLEGEGFLGNWISLPEMNKSILKINLNKTILGLLKSIFYKSDGLYIYVETKNGKRYSNRVVEKNIRDGLYLIPDLLQPFDCYDEATRFKLTTSSKVSYSNNFKFQLSETYMLESNRNKLFGSELCINYITETLASKDDELLFIEKEFHDLYEGSLMNLMKMDSTLIFNFLGSFEYKPEKNIYLVCQLENNKDKVLDVQMLLNEKLINEFGTNEFSELFEIPIKDVNPETVIKLFIWNPQLTDYHFQFSGINLLKAPIGKQDKYNLE